MLLLKRMRRDVRKGDLTAFESKLDELKQLLGWQRMVQVQCRYGCGTVISVPKSVFEHFTELRHKCGNLTSLKYQVQGDDQKPGAAADRNEPIQETKPQPCQPAKQLPLMLSWNCPRCHQVINVPRWYMDTHPDYPGMTHDCGARIEWPQDWLRS